MSEKKINLQLYGESYDITIANDETILDAALRQGIDAPYACMSGTCNSCQATVLEGKAEMHDAEALSEDEIKQGEILTCCAKPTTDFIKIKYLS